MAFVASILVALVGLRHLWFLVLAIRESAMQGGAVVARPGAPTVIEATGA